MMTTKFPLCCVLMELAEQLRARRLALQLWWLPREANTEADALTNGELGAFDASRRIAFDWESLPWRALPGLLKEGAAFAEQVAAQRAAGGTGTAEGSRRRAGLRERDPW